MDSRDAPDEPEKLHFTDRRGELVAKRVVVRAHVSGESEVKAVFAKSRAVCSRCGTERVFDASSDPRSLYVLMAGDASGEFSSETAEACGESGRRHSWIATPSDAGYRLTKKRVQLWREFHVTKVTEVTEKGTPPSPPPPDDPRRTLVGLGPRKKPPVTLLTDDDDGGP